MLRGIPRYCFPKMFHTYSRSHRFQNVIVQEILRFQDSSTIIQNHQNSIEVFSFDFRLTRIHLGFNIILFQDLTDLIKIPPCCFQWFFKTIVNVNCFGPTNIILKFDDPTLSQLSTFSIFQMSAISTNTSEFGSRF